MNRIEKLDNIDKTKKLSELGLNHTFYRAYKWSTETTNKLLNFSDIIWEYDVPEIIKNCKEYEIKEFTISSTFSNLLDVLAEFEKYGCKICELTKVTTSFTDTFTGKPEEINAIKVIIK